MSPSMVDFVHRPVLLRETARLLSFGSRPARLIDGTVGNGGHSAFLLRENPCLQVLGIDRDGDALARAERNLSFADGRVTLVRENFSRMAEVARSHGWETADAVLLDIGVSSPQLDDAARGFSWRMDGPLDMRMDQRSRLTASRLLNNGTEQELERIFREYGEIDSARRLARAVVNRRTERPFATTKDLADVCDQVLRRVRPGMPPAPTLAFQAVRIAVNDELGELEGALAAAGEILRRGGVLAVISFHSLEDRIVKRFFRRGASSCVCPPGLPVCICGKKREWRIITAKAVTPQADEVSENGRSSCARLRAAEKL